MKTVVIFGGSGFIGQHIVRRIAKKGYKIIVPYQRSTNEAKLRLFGNLGQIIPLKYSNVNDSNIINSIKASEAIINLRTLWKEKNNSFEKEIYQFNLKLINLIKKIDKNKFFIYFSGLGIEKDSHSKRTREIAKTEEIIKKISLNTSIIKPGIVIGGGDNFLKKLLPIFKISVFIPLFGSGEFEFEPVYVDDVAKAVEKIIISKLRGPHIYELTGAQPFTYKSFYLHIARCLDVKRFYIPIPFFLAKAGVAILEKTPINIITREQLNLFQSNNLPSNIDKKFDDLGITPQDIREIIKISIDKKT